MPTVRARTPRRWRERRCALTSSNGPRNLPTALGPACWRRSVDNFRPGTPKDPLEVALYVTGRLLSRRLVVKRKEERNAFTYVHLAPARALDVVASSQRFLDATRATRASITYNYQLIAGPDRRCNINSRPAASLSRARARARARHLIRLIFPQNARRIFSLRRLSIRTRLINRRAYYLRPAQNLIVSREPALPSYKY